MVRKVLSVVWALVLALGLCGFSKGSDASQSSSTTMRLKQGATAIDIERARPKASRPRDLESKTWTVFVYLCGTDLETDDEYGTNDLSEMVSVSGSEDVRFVVETGGAKKWGFEGLKGKKTQRLLICDGAVTELDRFSASDMGDPDTLSDFVVWGVENYPAEHMGLVLWDHGGGSVSGVCFDERSGSSLGLRDIDEALSQALDVMWDKFDFIGFDACLMSTLECANVLVPYADYLYGSEEVLGGDGWDYDEIGDYLSKNPSADGAKLGRVVADSYMENRADNYGESTFSVVDLAKVDPLLQSFNAYSKELLEGTGSPTDLAKVVRLVGQVDNFGGNNRAEGYTNMVDLKGLLEASTTVAPSAKTAKRDLERAVIYHVEGPTHEGAGGLSLYYPLSVEDADELKTYAGICVSPYYLSFVNRQARGATAATDELEDFDEDSFFLDRVWDWLLTDEAQEETGLFDYVDEAQGEQGASPYITFADEPQVDGGIYGFTLDKDGLAHTASVSALVYRMKGDDLIALGETLDVNGDWKTGEFFDQFDGYWLSLPDGQNLCTFVADGTDDYMVLTSPITLNGRETNLRIHVDLNDYECVVEGVWDGIDEDGVSGRGVREVEEGDKIVPLYLEEERGKEYVVDDDFYVIYDYLEKGTYAYSFSINDVYGNYLFTDPVTIKVSKKGKVTFVK